MSLVPATSSRPPPSRIATLAALGRIPAAIAADGALLARAVADARLAASLRSPNLLGVGEVERTPEGLRFALPAIAGVTLRDLLAFAERSGRTLPRAVSVRIALDVCAGLAALHEVPGLAHRAISARAVFVGADGVARLAGVGLGHGVAAALPGWGEAAREALADLPPEALAHGELSAAGDLFALGAVLWEMLVGRHPFLGRDDAETAANLRACAPPPLSQLFHDRAAGFDVALAIALDPRPARRFAGARSFAAALERLPVAPAAAAEVAAVVSRLLCPPPPPKPAAVALPEIRAPKPRVHAWTPSHTRPGLRTQKIAVDPDLEPTGQTLDTRRSRKLGAAPRWVDRRRPLAALGGVAVLAAIAWAAVGSRAAPRAASAVTMGPSSAAVTSPPALQAAPNAAPPSSAPIAACPAPPSSAPAPTSGAIEVSKLPDAPPVVIDVASLPDAPSGPAADARRSPPRPAADAQRGAPRATPAHPRADDGVDAPPPSRRRANPYR